MMPALCSRKMPLKESKLPSAVTLGYSSCVQRLARKSIKMFKIRFGSLLCKHFDLTFLRHIDFIDDSYALAEAIRAFRCTCHTGRAQLRLSTMIRVVSKHSTSSMLGASTSPPKIWRTPAWNDYLRPLSQPPSHIPRCCCGKSMRGWLFAEVKVSHPSMPSN